ncbi:drug/metabolite transporter (DMT)-like permease [Nocardia transvalensis]|uniref:Drug/metabolite transporter (DMT)-like permease n=1 Tax=Nocardia transvalensis TaxID=37333 RepID=A0A7W9PGN0_9NOCA|nr:DMT family transporter [Nocardia transvalensis]MBB5915747.1 drug/metabolite transporter (DMT)-like permease [Nocardia transvalensis]
MADLPVAAVSCAFVGAVLFAVSAVAQQRAAAEVPEGEAFLARLVRSPRWWAGIVGDAGGFAFQVAALALGSVLVVQPILVTALVFALPLAAHYSGRRVSARMWAQAVALSVALAVFLVVGDPTEGVTNAPWRDWIWPMGLLLGVTAVGVVAGFTARNPAVRALLLGTAAGLLFGLAAALTGHVTELFGQSAGAVLTSWQPYTLVASGIVGLYLQQRGYQVGPLSASLPAFTVAEPLGAAFIGITVLEERLRSGPVGTVFVLLAVVVMGVEAVRLSRAQAVEAVVSVE